MMKFALRIRIVTGTYTVHQNVIYRTGKRGVQIQYTFSALLASQFDHLDQVKEIATVHFATSTGSGYGLRLDEARILHEIWSEKLLENTQRRVYLEYGEIDNEARTTTWHLLDWGLSQDAYYASRGQVE